MGRAVDSALCQEFPGEVEVIVVNDFGEPLKPAAWQEDPRVMVLTTQRVNRCFAWNTAFSVCRGDYINIIGDDDMLLSGAYAALSEAAQSSGAAWVYGWHECVDDYGNLLYTIEPTDRGDLFALAVAGGNIPLQASIIKREAFLAVGGLDPRFMAAEDAELFQRITMSYRVEYVEHFVARIRVGPQGATTTKWHLAKEMNRLGRELRFCYPRCLRLLIRSLRQNKGRDDIRGKLVRYYVGSAWRHLRQGCLLTFLSRLGAAGVVGSLGLPSKAFLQALRADGNE